MPRLIVLAGPDRGKEFPLAESMLVVGRHEANAIVLTDPQVSRKHLELTSTPEGYRFCDLGSGNGTRWNDRTAAHGLLATGDRLSLGDTVLQFAGDPVPPPLPGLIRRVPEDAGSVALTHPTGSGGQWLQTKLTHLNLLYEASAAVGQILDLDELLKRLLDLIVRSTDADHGCILLIDDDTGELLPHTTRSKGLAPAPFALSRTIVDFVRQSREGVLVSDAAVDERFAGGDSIVRHGIREVIAVPMKGRHESIGVLFLDTLAPSTASRPGTKFTEDHLILAATLAHQAALAVEETRYYQAKLNAERLAAVGQTIAGLSHHIKNIMQGVRFGSDMVRSGLSDNDAELLRRGWSLVERNQDRINELITDMLSISKEREAGTEPTSLAGLIRETVEMLQGRMQESRIALDLADLPELTVPCDPVGIQRALLNVLSNAIDALQDRPDPRIRIDLTIDQNSAVITISDNGPGVPEELRDEIFKPFVSTKGSRGTGLGLPASRKTLREHGGDLTVETGDSGGARFVMRLPR